MNHGAHRECTSGKGETEHVKVYSAGPTGEEVRRGSCEGGDDDADGFATLLCHDDGARVANSLAFRAEFAGLSAHELYTDEWRTASLPPAMTVS